MSGGEAAKIGRNAVVYLIPSVLVRGLNFLLAPVLTQYLTPADYGVVGLASTLTMLFGLLLGLAVHGSVTRIHFECESARERSVFYGTLLLLLLVGSGAAAGALQAAGLLGAFDGIRSLDFHPHLELALWTAYAQLFVVLRTAMLQAREQARAVGALNAAVALIHTSVSLFLVIAWGWGAVGVMTGQLIGQGCVALYCIVVTARESTLTFSGSRAAQALAFSLPLLPHIAANWGLSVSDRLILERSVSTAELGVYALGYMFCSLASMVANAVADALSPAIIRTLRADSTSPAVPPLGTLAVAAICWACTGAAILGPDAIVLLTPSSYWGASRIVPWVVLGAAFHGIYLVVSQGTWFSMKTRAVPLVTIVAAAVNIGLNLWLVPRFGIMAAAVNTAAAYAITALLHDRLAARLHFIPWPYAKWSIAAGAALAAFALSRTLPDTLPLPLTLGLRAVLAVLGYPLALQAFGVVDLRQFTKLRRGGA